MADHWCGAQYKIPDGGYLNCQLKWRHDGDHDYNPALAPKSTPSKDEQIASLRAQLAEWQERSKQNAITADQWKREADRKDIELAEAREKLKAAVVAYPTPEQMAQGLETGRYGRTPLGVYDRFDSKNCPTGLVDVCRKYLASLPAPAAEGEKPGEKA